MRRAWLIYVSDISRAFLGPSDVVRGARRSSLGLTAILVLRSIDLFEVFEFLQRAYSILCAASGPLTWQIPVGCALDHWALLVLRDAIR